MTIYLERYSDFLQWCEDNCYSDEEHEVEEEQYKRDTLISCYIKKKDEDKYAQLSYTQSYDDGAYNFQIVNEGLIRKEEQVVVAKIKFVKE